MTKDELKRYKYISDEIAQLWDEINRLRDGLMSRGRRHHRGRMISSRR